MDYYGNDADKARQNPDNVWTASLVSNTVTVEIVAGKNPEPPRLPGSHLTLKEACGEKFEHAALWEALNEPDSSDRQHSEEEKKAGVFHFAQEYRLVNVIAGKRAPRLDLPSPYRCDRGAGERPIQKGERVIWVFQRLGGKDGGMARPVKALPVTAANIEAVVDAVHGKKRWGPASNGIQAGVRCKAINLKPEPDVVLVLSVRNVGTKPVRLPCRSRSIEVTKNGKLYPFCGPKAVPPPPPRVESFIELAPGAVDSAEVRTVAVNRGLEDFRGAEMTFVYANDSATAIASPFDQTTGKLKQVTGLWAGTARSGTITLDGTEAQEKGTRKG